MSITVQEFIDYLVAECARVNVHPAVQIVHEIDVWAVNDEGIDDVQTDVTSRGLAAYL